MRRRVHTVSAVAHVNKGRDNLRGTKLGSRSWRTKKGTAKQIYGASFSPKETTATEKERPNLLMEVKNKTYYGLKTMARKFLKYGQVERTLMHIQNTPKH